MATSRVALLLQCLKLYIILVVVVVVVALMTPSSSACYTSIFSFGDSLADTGNLYYYKAGRHGCFFPPYGETYFGHPKGRCSDGRLVVDFIAESLGLPLLKPYLGIDSSDVVKRNIKQGVNFAVIGATALDIEFFQQKQIHIPTNLSLNVQLQWFKQLLPTLCDSSSSCKRILRKSLVLMGEIGGNDFNYPLGLKRGLQEIETYIPHVLNTITSVIKELIDLGAVTIIVPGNFPIGCSPMYLTIYDTTHKEEYDEVGCIKWLNNFAENFNQQLQAALDQFRVLHPHTNIIYADYFSIGQGFYHDPEKYGFTGSALEACCGGGGPYNYNTSTHCGRPGTKACDDPSKYISWDGVHYTEAAYNWVAKSLLHGSYTIPKITASCISNKLTATTSVST